MLILFSALMDCRIEKPCAILYSLIIVEAMKMELVIYAPQSGRIKRINCQPGHQVSPGDALLWLELESI
ncbi:acetyl-CoA carboxylase biotin carboxyl carrier protein subunit [Xenorhabdus cabanillasii]|uniref:acetyl-CoA carboxylase biotin carboxyl carrier protein subunit n=1 Tax=Xenorhabdus cabanillasii TaxID=351673 RepID=UPI0038CD409F